MPTLVLLLLSILAVCSGGKAVKYHEQDSLLLADAAEALTSIGVQGLCHPTSYGYEPYFPHCSNDARYLEEEVTLEDDNKWFYLENGLMAALCVVTAALAAGLTMGLLSIDPLMLLIKMRAGATEEERQQAASLLPIVKQHHLLLVTLLLLNSMANEALPLFLDKLVPSYVAVILSVTLVLFVGEIGPSALFTGPSQVKIASRLVPLVKLFMALLFPIAYPVAKLLDCILHEDEDGSSVYNRKELSALVRIQYEERLANKRQKRAERAQAGKHYDLTHDEIPPAILDESIREAKRELASHQQQRSPSIHFDEVSMVEGALSMKTKVAVDVYTPLRKVHALPLKTELDEGNIVRIYSSGYSRIPVYQPNPEKPKDITGICGVLMTKQLIVVDANDKRPLDTLPLFTPMCVSPKENLVDLINMFQTGESGHMALVCARSDVATAALNRGEALPPSAGLMGIITLEDCLEALLREQIYDEMDKLERDELRLAKWVSAKWKLYVRQKKLNREEEMLRQTNDPRILGIVDKAVTELNPTRAEGPAANDSTPLLGDADEEPLYERNSGFLASFFHK